METQIALVTGASRGIGAAIAEVLAQQGYFVCINYLTHAAMAESLVIKIKSSGGKAVSVQADISREAEVVKLFENILHDYGPVSALVNNAGIDGGESCVEDVSCEKLQTIFSLNVFGTFISIREAVKHMKQQGGGSIVNITSEAARFGGSRMSIYAASKAAINTATIGLARETAPYRIRINAVSPGIVATDMQKNISPERRREIDKSLPMGRMAEPYEVARTVAWLLSNDAGYVSGAVISVSGAR